jgi:eukaryotic-like serine/threonine-protein kinase
MNEPVGKLVEVLLVDQNQRWARGTPRAVESYLDEHPNLRRDDEALLDLIYGEIFLRGKAGDHPTVEEYIARFPHFAEQLKLQFQIHHAFDPEELFPRVAPDTTLEDSPVAISGGMAREIPRIEGFEILGELGRGSSGVVYHARCQHTNRYVALKVLQARARTRPALVERFLTEAKALAALNHPNIVKIYMVGDAPGSPPLTYFAMELVEGQSLCAHLAGKPQPSKDSVRLVETLARAMHYAHTQQIIHRDIKPANVLLTRAGEPKITDFGLAKRLDSNDSQTRSGTILGTPVYMAPEQAEGKAGKVGPAADVYSLGAVLYEMLTGRPPYLPREGLAGLLVAWTQELIPPRTLRPTLPRDIEAICLRCLARDPAQRYASAAELADDLARFQQGKPVKARPVDITERLSRWSLRRPVAAMLTATCLAVSVAFGASWLLVALKDPDADVPVAGWIEPTAEVAVEEPVVFEPLPQEPTKVQTHFRGTVTRVQFGGITVRLEGGDETRTFALGRGTRFLFESHHRGKGHPRLQSGDRVDVQTTAESTRAVSVRVHHHGRARPGV